MHEITGMEAETTSSCCGDDFDFVTFIYFWTLFLLLPEAPSPHQAFNNSNVKHQNWLRAHFISQQPLTFIIWFDQGERLEVTSSMSLLRPEFSSSMNVKIDIQIIVEQTALKRFKHQTRFDRQTWILALWIKAVESSFRRKSTMNLVENVFLLTRFRLIRSSFSIWFCAKRFFVKNFTESLKVMHFDWSFWSFLNKKIVKVEEVVRIQFFSMLKFLNCLLNFSNFKSLKKWNFKFLKVVTSQGFIFLVSNGSFMLLKLLKTSFQIFKILKNRQVSENFKKNFNNLFKTWFEKNLNAAKSEMYWLIIIHFVHAIYFN